MSYSPYDPTQPVPPPIEPTQVDDLSPPPAPLAPASLPYFQVKNRVQTSTIVAVGCGVIMLASIVVFLVAALVANAH